MSLEIAWIQMDTDTAIVCSGYFLIIVFMLLRRSIRIYKMFKVHESEGSLASMGPPSLNKNREQFPPNAFDSNRSMHNKQSFSFKPRTWRRSHTESDSWGQAPLLDNDIEKGNAHDSLHHSHHSLSATHRDSHDSEPDCADVVATRLALEGGGWLLKKAHRVVSGNMWLKRWVFVEHGVLQYSRSMRGIDKHLPLDGLLISLGNDGLSIRLHDAQNVKVYEWKCDSSPARDGWVRYIKAGRAGRAQTNGTQEKARKM